MAGLAGGADAAYIHEEKFGIKDLMKVIHFRSKKKADHSRRFVFIGPESDYWLCLSVTP